MYVVEESRGFLCHVLMVWLSKCRWAAGSHAARESSLVFQSSSSSWLDRLECLFDSSIPGPSGRAAGLVMRDDVFRPEEESKSFGTRRCGLFVRSCVYCASSHYHVFYLCKEEEKNHLNDSITQKVFSHHHSKNLHADLYRTLYSFSLMWLITL